MHEILENSKNLLTRNEANAFLRLFRIYTRTNCRAYITSSDLKKANQSLRLIKPIHVEINCRVFSRMFSSYRNYAITTRELHKLVVNNADGTPKPVMD